MAGVPAEQQAAEEETISFDEWMDFFSEATPRRTFAAETTLPSDEEIADYCIRFARAMKPEATDGEMVVLTAKLFDMASRARQSLADGNLAMLQHIHGSRQGGGKGVSLKVPKEEHELLNQELLAEYNDFGAKQTAIKNGMAQNKFGLEASKILCSPTLLSS